MHYIVFDLEFTVLRQRQYTADILEIGAGKLCGEDRTLTMVDLFHTYVRPTEHRAIGAETTRLTGITQGQVDQAPDFVGAASAFRDWLQTGDILYYLCTWGPDDKHQLLRHCVRYDLPVDWIRNFNDIQLQFTRPVRSIGAATGDSDLIKARFP